MTMTSNATNSNEDQSHRENNEHRDAHPSNNDVSCSALSLSPCPTATTTTVLNNSPMIFTNNLRPNDDYTQYCHQLANMKMIARVAPVASSVDVFRDNCHELRKDTNEEWSSSQLDQMSATQQQHFVYDTATGLNCGSSDHKDSSSASSSVLSSVVSSSNRGHYQNNTTNKHQTRSHHSQRAEKRNSCRVSSLPHHYRRGGAERIAPTPDTHSTRALRSNDAFDQDQMLFVSTYANDNSINCKKQHQDKLLTTQIDNNYQTSDCSHQFTSRQGTLCRPIYQNGNQRHDQVLLQSHHNHRSSKSNLHPQQIISGSASDLLNYDYLNWSKRQNQRQLQHQTISAKQNTNEQAQEMASDYNHPIGELRLICKLVNGGIRSRNGCKCGPCRQFAAPSLQQTSANVDNNNNKQYLNVHQDGQHLHIENPFELVKHHRSKQKRNPLLHHQQQCNRFRFEGIVDCRQKTSVENQLSWHLCQRPAATSSSTYQITPQSSKFDLMIKSLIKSFIIHGTDACIVSLGNDSGQTQSTMFGPASPLTMFDHHLTNGKHATANSDCCPDNIIEAMIPKSMIYCYQLIDRLMLDTVETRRKASTTNEQDQIDISYQISLKCLAVAQHHPLEQQDHLDRKSNGSSTVDDPGAPSSCIYDLLLDGDLRNMTIAVSSTASRPASSSADLLYRDIDARQVERRCDKTQDFMDILQSVWLRYNELCQLQTKQPQQSLHQYQSLPNMIMKVTLTKTTKSINNNDIGDGDREVFTSSSRFCLLDLHPSETNLNEANGWSHHLISMLSNRSKTQLATDGCQKHITTNRRATHEQQTILMSFLKAYLNGALTKSLVLVHLNDCEMTFKNNVDLSKLALIMQQFSAMRLQRRKRFMRMYSEQQNNIEQQENNNIDNNDISIGGSSSGHRMNDITNTTSGFVDHHGSSSLTSQSSIDTVVHNQSNAGSGQPKERARIKGRLSEKVDLNALLLSPRRIPFLRIGHSDRQIDKAPHNRSNTCIVERRQCLSRNNDNLSRTKLYMIDCHCPSEGQHSAELDSQSPRAETPPFPRAPSIHDSLTSSDPRIIGCLDEDQNDTNQRHLSSNAFPDIDIQSQSETMSDVVAEPPKQLKLEQFLQQLTTIITPLKQQTDDCQQSLSLEQVKMMSSSNSLSLIPLPPLNNNHEDDDCCSHSSIMNHLSSLTTVNNDLHETSLDNGATESNCNQQLYSKVRKPTPLRSSSYCDEDHQSNKACSTSSGCSSSTNNSSTLKNRSHPSNSHHDEILSGCPHQLNDCDKKPCHRCLRELIQISGNSSASIKRIHQQLDFHNQQQTSSGYTSSCNTSMINCNSTGDLQQIISATRCRSNRGVVDTKKIDTAFKQKSSVDDEDNTIATNAEGKLGQHDNCSTELGDIILSNPDSGLGEGKISSSSSSGHHSENEDDNYGTIRKSSCSLLCCRFPYILNVGPSGKQSKC